MFIGGDDFKSGQTKVKSVLVDFLVSAGIKVRHGNGCMVVFNVPIYSQPLLFHITTLEIMMEKIFQLQSSLDLRRYITCTKIHLIRVK